MSKRALEHFIDNIELWLSVAGLLVVWASTAVLGPTGAGVWRIAAVTALGISVLHSAIFWVVRRRQRVIRAESVHEIREMLTDQVKNQLSIMRLWMPEGEGREEFESHFDGIAEAIDHVDTMVDGLTEEKLRAWKANYSNAAEHVQLPATA